MTLLGFLRNSTFLIITCATLAVSTAGLALKSVQLSAQVAGFTASAATAAIANRRAISAAVARTKARARLRRTVTSIPLVGVAALAAFERQDYLEWQEENPNGTKGEYGCEVATLSAEFIDEVLQEMPEWIRPSQDTVLSILPECDKAAP